MVHMVIMADDIQSGRAHGVASPGAALAAARTEHGLTVAQVAGQLRLTPVQIRAIEADDFSVLSGAVFARGYVRNYARLLKLDAAPLLEAMSQQAPVVDASPNARLLHDVKGVAIDPVRIRGLPIAAVVIVAVVGVLAFYEFVLSEVLSSKPAVQVRSVPSERAAVSPAAPLVPVPAASPTTLDEEKKAVVETAAHRGLHFLFSRESWVEVRDGVGKILFSQVNLPGTEQMVQGDPPFKIVVGSVRGVQLAYKGRPVDLVAHATEDVARLQLE